MEFLNDIRLAQTRGGIRMVCQIGAHVRNFKGSQFHDRKNVQLRQQTRDED
jgi:hypothetical protein